MTYLAIGQSTLDCKAGRWRRNAISMIASVSLVTASVAGCTTQQQRIGADDGTDSCRTYVVALDSTGDYYAEDMIQGAAVGALGGALIGGLTGGWKGAIAGGVIGAAVGAAGGYWKHKMDQGRDQAILGVVSDMQREGAQLDKTNAAFKQLSDCRHNAAAQVRARYASKQITREDAQGQLQHIGALAAKDLEILRSIDANENKRVSEYQYAASQIDPNVPAPAPEPQATQPNAAPTPVQKQPVRHTTSNTGGNTVVQARPQSPKSTQELASLQQKQSTLKNNTQEYAEFQSSVSGPLA